MSKHRYPGPILWADYLRAAFGLAITAGPVLLLDLAQVMSLLFAGLAGLFAWFAVRTALRQASWIELTPEAIALRGPIEQTLPWADLRRVKLAYYGPRRARERGWMQLTLRGPDRPIRLDSTVEGFEEIMHHVQDAVVARGLALDPTTSSNFEALGLDPEAAGRQADPAR